MIDQPPMNGSRGAWPNDSFVGLLPPRERHRLFLQGRRKEYPGGSYLVRQGGPGQDVLVVLSGKVRIMVAGLRRNHQQIASRQRGDLIGELSYLDTRPRSASALAAGPVTSWYLPREVFDRYLNTNPLAYRSLAQSLTDRLRDSEQRFVGASIDVEGRVAMALCNGGDVGNGSIRVWRTQAQLAQQVGASIVSVHRALRKFAALGLVETEHRSILVKAPAALGEIAGL